MYSRTTDKFVSDIYEINLYCLFASTMVVTTDAYVFDKLQLITDTKRRILESQKIIHEFIELENPDCLRN